MSTQDHERRDPFRLTQRYGKAGNDDARDLVWLRDLLGERFRGGAVLHTRPLPFQLADRVLALPICTLWG